MIWAMDLVELGARPVLRLAGEKRLTETDRLAHLDIWFDLASNLAGLHRGIRRRLGRTTCDEREWYG